MRASEKSADVDISPPEPDLTPDELLCRATAMRHTLRTRQEACEEAGRILDETNDEQCVRLTCEAVELMFRTAGTSSAAKAAPLGCYFRNLAVVRTHLTLQSDHTAGNAARLHFGSPPLSRL